MKSTSSIDRAQHDSAGVDPRIGWRSMGALALFFVLVFGIAAFASTFTPGAWYDSLDKPSFNPPSWLFAPVWSVLYATVAVAAWLVWRRAPVSRHPWAWAAFSLQLLLNGLWSFLFFGLHRPWLASIEIALLWLAVAATTLLFGRIRLLAGLLLLPYLAWVGFAVVLNLALASLNG